MQEGCWEGAALCSGGVSRPKGAKQIKSSRPQARNLFYALTLGAPPAPRDAKQKRPLPGFPDRGRSFY